MIALGQIGLLVIVLLLVQWPLGNALAAAAGIVLLMALPSSRN